LNENHVFPNSPIFLALFFISSFVGCEGMVRQRHLRSKLKSNNSRKKCLPRYALERYALLGNKFSVLFTFLIPGHQVLVDRFVLYAGFVLQISSRHQIDATIQKVLSVRREHLVIAACVNNMS